MQLYKDPTDEVHPFLAEKYDREAARYWDKFYRRNGSKFFKDRHYLEEEFADELCADELTLLEVGCGAGNTVFPLLERHPNWRIYACDFSPTAVALVRSHAQYDAERLTAFVADLTEEAALDAALPPSAVDVVTMVFVLSAISPEKMGRAVANIRRVLKPGGHVLLRDYAEGDLAQLRMGEEGKQQRISDNFYVRGDGTCAYYFSHQRLNDIFQAHGFQCTNIFTHERQMENRAKSQVSPPILSACAYHADGQVMDRRWVQAVFSLPGGSAATSQVEQSTIRFTGAAGRLASAQDSPNRFGRAWLPESLDPADVTAAEISPAKCSMRGSTAAYEAQLERTFAEIVGQDTDEVVAEEVAAMLARGGAVHPTELGEVDALAEIMDTMVCGGSTEGGSRHWGELPIEMEPYAHEGCSSNDGGNSEARIPSLESLYDHVCAGGIEFRLDASASTSAPQEVTVLGAAPAVARWISLASSAFSGKTVLDLWCGALPLCSLMASRWCRYSVAAARSAGELATLKKNLFLNADKFIIERVQAAEVAEGGCPRDESTRRLTSAGFDVILCTTLGLSSQSTAVSTALSIFKTAVPLMSQREDTVLLLGLINQCSDHVENISAAATQFGLICDEDYERELLNEVGINTIPALGATALCFSIARSGTLVDSP